MRALIQRVKQSSVSVNKEVISSIGPGLLVFLGVGREDTLAEADYLVDKIINLRIFEDHEGKMNLSLKDSGGEILVVSQFTLLADCRKGRRPSFIKAALPDDARQKYDYFCKQVKNKGIRTQTGKFRAMMEVSLVNDGPVTLLVEKSAGE